MHFGTEMLIHMNYCNAKLDQLIYKVMLDYFLYLANIQTQRDKQFIPIHFYANKFHAYLQDFKEIFYISYLIIIWFLLYQAKFHVTINTNKYYKIKAEQHMNKCIYIKAEGDQ